MGQLDGHVALITGGASGIGAACARRFAAEGAALALVDVEDPTDLLVELERTGTPVDFHRCDVRDEAGLEAVFARTAERHGRIDAVVASAGINGIRAPLESMTSEGFDELVSVNLKGSFLTARAAAPHLKKQKGSLTFVGSVQGVRTFYHAGTSLYCATKAGIAAMSRNLAMELSWSGVRVNTVCPGTTRTNIESSTRQHDVSEIDIRLTFPRGRPMLGGYPADPDRVADVCLFLASDQARHVTGAELIVDGGQSVMG